MTKEPHYCEIMFSYKFTGSYNELIAPLKINKH